MQFRLELSGGDPFTGARVTSGLPNRFLLLVNDFIQGLQPLGDEWWGHRVLHVESNFICNLYHATYAAVIFPR